MKLKDFAIQRLREHYVKISTLKWDDSETGLEIQGIVTGGNISVNGNSAIRRSGSLSCVVDKKTLNPNITDINNEIAIDKRIKIEIGLKASENITNEDNEVLYAPDANNIVWFPQGIFIITGASVQHNTNNITMSINFKDKMALLNGESGGTFSMGITHSPLYDIDEQGKTTKDAVLFRELIKTLVKDYGQIPEDLIDISFDDTVSSTPIYNNENEQIGSKDRIKNLVRWTGSYPIYGYQLPQPETEDDIMPTPQTYRLTTVVPTVSIYDTYTFGDTIGYQYTDFVYPTESELTSNAGETIVSVLDKIKNVLGNYEYFFDIDGKFHFQPIDNLLFKGSDSIDIIGAIKDSQDISLRYQGSDDISYDFNDNEIVTAFNNTPQWVNIKNDISVWGMRSDDKSPIQYHLVIDDKPSFDKKLYTGMFYQDPYDVTIWRLRPKGERKQSTDLELEFEISDYRTWIYYNYVHNGIYHPDGKELQEFWPKIYDLALIQKNSSDTWEITGSGGFKLLNYEDPKIFLNSMPYYYEIMDKIQIEGETAQTIEALEQIKVSKIGRRTKSINDKSVNILFSIDPPDLAYVEAGRAKQTKQEREEAVNQGLFIQLTNNFTKHIALGSALNSAYETMRAMLNEVINYNESVSITCLPIYHIEPNTRITAQDSDAGLNNKTSFIVNSYSIPLASNGTMTLQCTKDINKL